MVECEHCGYEFDISPNNYYSDDFVKKICKMCNNVNNVSLVRVIQEVNYVD